jgi:phosphoglycerate dehydrogenase-like enzyme
MERLFVYLRLAEWEKRIIEDVLGEKIEILYWSGADFSGLEDSSIAMAVTLPREAIERAGKLKFVQVPAAGADNLDLEALFDRNVMVATAKGCNARAVAEHAFALMLSLAKKIVEQDLEVKNGKWRSYTEENFLLDLEGSTLTIVGYGNIGREIARIAKAFNMKVVAVKKNPERDEYCDECYGQDKLKEALSQADYAVIALPLTRETRGLIGEEELKSMKKTAYIINIGRGPVIDENALYKALTQGWIAGAGIDVWWTYPPSQGYPSSIGVHRLPNVIATPHKAGWTKKSREKCLRFAAENIARYLRGEKPLNVLTQSREY